MTALTDLVDLHGHDVSDIVATYDGPLVGLAASAEATNEQQTITVDATSGTFTVSFGGQTTSALAENCSAATLEAALELLSSIGAANVNVTGGAGGPFTLEFVGDLAAADVAQVTCDSTLLAGGTNTATPATTVPGVPGTVINIDVSPANEQQTITVDASGGTFAVIWRGRPTAAVAENASAATLKTALEAVMGAGNIDVTGGAGGPWTLEFIGDLAEMPVPQVECDATLLTGGASTAVPATTVPGVSGHGMAAGQSVVLGDLDGGAPLSEAVVYFVLADNLDSTALSLGTAAGGSPVAITSAIVSGTIRTAWPLGISPGQSPAEIAAQLG